MERLKKTLRQYHIWDETLSARIHPVAGDLAKPLLGLRPAQFSELAQKIDAIYHSAALVNFLYPYSALKATNVLGTQEILRLACQEQLKAVHYISTIDVFLANNTMRPFLEADLQPLEQERNLGQDPGDYTRSKWIAEKIVTLARARGVPIAIYRPGLLMGHTQTGATQTTDYLLVALRGFLELGIVPEHFHLFDAVPIDYASRSIVHISQQPDSFGKYFHLWNPRPINMRLFYDWIESYGYRFEIVPFAVGRERGMQVDPTHPLYPMIPVLREAQDETPPSFDPQLLDTLDVRVECANTLRALEGSGIECPQMDERLAHLIFSYLIEVGFYSSPEELVGADQAPGSAA
jgi:myxalamid-type nonribosomal peptide synthetase MxaA